MTNPAKAGLTLAVLIVIIVVGVIWYMGSSTVPAAPAEISFDPAQMTAGTAAASRNDISDKTITADIAAIDSEMNSLNADASAMNASAAATSSMGTTTANSLIQRLNTLHTLTSTEKSVLAANLRADTSMRLVAPEIGVLAAADRIYGIVDMFQPLYAKLQARVAQASTTPAAAGHPDWSATLSEIDAKLTDARAQAGAAHDEVIALKPDQNNRTAQQTNAAALKDARKKIGVAIQDLLTARQDAGKTIQGLASGQ